LDTSSIESAWERFFEGKEKVDAAELRRQGWMSAIDIAKKLKTSRDGGFRVAKYNVEKGELETKQFYVSCPNGASKLTNFYRPIK
jgi:hypothetical protein